jgi:hypothetical protein
MRMMMMARVQMRRRMGGMKRGIMHGSRILGAAVLPEVARATVNSIAST